MKSAPDQTTIESAPDKRDFISFEPHLQGEVRHD